MSSLLIQRFISQYGNLASRYDYVSATGTMDKQTLFYLSLIGIVVGIGLIVISSILKKSNQGDGQLDEYAGEIDDEYAGEIDDEYADQSADPSMDELGVIPVKKTKKSSLLRKILLVTGIIIILLSSTGAGYYGFIYYTKFLPQYKEWHSRLPSNAVQDLLKL
jgi:hypothetical protein